MATTAIIDTSTRVIRALTSTPSPALAASESAVVVADGMNLAGGPWKLDVGNNKVAATATEYNNSGYNEVFNATQRAARKTTFKNSFAAVQADATVPATLKTLLTAWLAVEQDR